MRAINFIIILYLSAVQCGFGPGEQDYGYETVRGGAHMFWWFYHSTAGSPTERPIILWLLGGPGFSSCGSGNFMMIGPRDETLRDRESTWIKDFNILFVDAPVGSGYSHVDDESYLNSDNKESAQDLVEVIRAFYNKLPQYQSTPFYIFGIGYGAKIGAEAIRLLYDEVQGGRIQANVKGLSIASSWISPMDEVMAIPTYLYQVSLIDEDGKAFIENHTAYMQQTFDSGNYLETGLEWYKLINIIYDVTDGIDLTNIIFKSPKSPPDPDPDSKHKVSRFVSRNKIDTRDDMDIYLLMNGVVKESFDIPELINWTPLSNEVPTNLASDFMRPATSIIQSILEDTNIEVHISSGNLDLLGNTPGQFRWINKLQWKNVDQFKNAQRTTMWVDGKMEGYTKKGGGLSFYWINKSGHYTIVENVAGTRAFLKEMTGF